MPSISLSQTCDDVVKACDKALTMKDLVIQEQDRTITLLEKQRDEKPAGQGPFNKVLLFTAGVSMGCAAMGQKEEIRLICLAGAVVSCVLGGCK